MAAESIWNGTSVAVAGALGPCLRSKKPHAPRRAFNIAWHFGRVLRYGGLGFPSANQAGDQELAVWRGIRLNCLGLQFAG